MSTPDPNGRINLSKASVLLIDGSQHSVDVLAQIMKGFGVAEVQRCITLEEAEKFAVARAYDLIVIDPAIGEGEGFNFLNTLRHSEGAPNCFTPIVLVTGHTRTTDVVRARDTGANFVVAKPITPNVLLQRIQWVARDKRPFVEVGSYVGPDRRFKFEGPPAGSDGRRADDLSEPLGEADEPNMSQNEIDSMIKPQRVTL